MDSICDCYSSFSFPYREREKFHIGLFLILHEWALSERASTSERCGMEWLAWASSMDSVAPFHDYS